jgi:DNA polymerase-1
MKTRPPKLLIDADYFWYRAASSAEEEHEYNADLTVIVGDFKRGKQIVEHELTKLRQRFNSDDILLFFTDRTNFRKTIDPSYKGNRTKRKPCGYLKLKNWGIDTYPSLVYPHLEADDVLGIIATNGSVKDFVLISPDKDMAQIPCRIYDLKDEYTQTPEKAHRLLYKQCLTGDSTDGYKGCAGVGPKRADQILDKAKGNYWQAVVEAFEEAEMTEADAIRNLQLAKILQAENWDVEKQTPILITS